MIIIEEPEYNYSLRPTKKERKIMKSKKHWNKAMARKAGKTQTCIRCPFANSSQCIDCKHKEK